MHVVELLYEAAGRPPQPEVLTVDGWEKLRSTKTKATSPPTGNCYLTGIALNGRGVPCAKRLKDTSWTAHNTAVSPDSEWLSEAAVLSINEAASHPDEPKPFKMRTKTHLVEGDSWTVLGMGDKEPMKAALLGAYPHAEPWFLAICDAPLSSSHIVYQARLNLPGQPYWTVSLGNSLVFGSAAELTGLLTAVETLYAANHTKTAMRHGDYNTKWIAAQGEKEWARLERLVRPYRGRPLFDLALFLAQKGE